MKRLDYDRLVVLFGCGGDRDRGKRPLMGAAVARYADKMIVTSDNPRHEDPLRIIQDILPGLGDFTEYVCEPDRKKAICLALDELGENDVLLIAGKGHEDYQQVGDTKYDFNDYQVARKHLAKTGR